MSKENGFAPLRRGLWEHVRDGRLSLQDVAVYSYIISQADTRTGIWKGSAGALVGELAMKPRTARDVLERLEHRDYIRRFLRPGERFCYPILVHKFPITQGEHRGEVINALSSTFSNGCLDLAYFPCEVSVEVDGEVGAPQRRKEKEEKKKPAAKPPADIRFGPFLEFAKTSFEAKHGQPATWDCFGKDGAALAAFLRRAPHVTLEIWTAHLNAYFDSTEQFTVKQGGSLSYFVSRFDTFSKGPILQQGGTNAGSKKLTGDDLTAANLRAAGFVQ